jgi:hypothetical protein
VKSSKNAHREECNGIITVVRYWIKLLIHNSIYYNTESVVSFGVDNRWKNISVRNMRSDRLVKYKSVTSI